MTSADVVIVGGGVIGAACAEALSREGLRIMLIERLGLASGTSSACQSGVGHGLSGDDYDLQLDQAAIAEYRALVADGALIEYERTGALLVCEPDEAAPVKARLPHLRELGFDCAWLDESALREAEPALSSAMAGAALLADMGQVSPMRTVMELAKRAGERGARILTNTELIGIEMTGGRVTAALTETERIATERLVIAAGVWSAEVGKYVGLRVPVWPLKGHVLVTEPLPRLLRHYLTSASYEVGVAATFAVELGANGPIPMPPQVACVLQPLPSGQILIGSSREFAGMDREVNRERLRQIAQHAVHVVPRFGAGRVIRTYAGLRPWTPDGRPLIGPTRQAEGVSIATGHGGEGNTRALLTGRLLADLLMGRTPPIDPGPLSPDRFVMN